MKQSVTILTLYPVISLPFIPVLCVLPHYCSKVAYDAGSGDHSAERSRGSCKHGKDANTFHRLVCKVVAVAPCSPLCEIWCSPVADGIDLTHLGQSTIKMPR